MWTTRLVPRVFKSPSILRQTSLITSVPQRNFCFRWGKKYRDIYGPSSWNTPEKRYDSNHRMGQVKERTQDPLYIDDRIKHIDGGISAYITRLHDEKIYDIPLRSMAFILYNEAREKRNEKLVYKRFEENYHRLISTSIVAREAFGGLWACYQSNCASLEGIAFWEEKLKELAQDLHPTWIKELLQAFNNNKQLKASHMNKIIDEYLKPRLLEVWDPKLLYNQRTMNDLIVEFKKLNYYDEEIFEKIIDSLLVKKRIQNIYLFETFHQFMNEVNENPKGSLYQKWTEKINQFEEKHYTADFKWRYNAEERRRRTHKELVARRDEFDWEDFVEVETTDEREERERKRIEEEQQRKYSVYNKELFVKQVKKYRAEGKTMIEMMVYLDVDEEALENAFQAISQEEQLERLEELRKENKLPFAEGTTV